MSALMTLRVTFMRTPKIEDRSSRDTSGPMLPRLQLLADQRKHVCVCGANWMVESSPSILGYSNAAASVLPMRIRAGP